MMSQLQSWCLKKRISFEENLFREEPHQCRTEFNMTEDQVI